MYSVRFDDDGVHLEDAKKKRYILSSPVFGEELKLFGLDKYWNVPETSMPLMWKTGRYRTYILNGRRIGRVTYNGINVFDMDVDFDPNQIKKDVKNNKDILKEMEDEAISFICDVYEKFGNNHIFVSFSGGKDSTVVLHLVEKCFSELNEEFNVLFVNTTLESEHTLDFVYKTVGGLKNFIELHPESDAYSLMVKYGIPTRLNRWCCKKLKLEPIQNGMSDYLREGVLSFEGTRRCESPRRNKYRRIEVYKVFKGETKVHPILEWNDVEVWLYIYWRGLGINEMYRYGFTRCGCIFCPYHTKLVEKMCRMLYDVEKYWDLLKSQLESIGLDSEKYISNGYWKHRYDFSNK